MACLHGISSLDWGSATVELRGRSVTLRIGCKNCGVRITKECSTYQGDELPAYRVVGARDDMVAVSGD